MKGVLLLLYGERRYIFMMTFEKFADRLAETVSEILSNAPVMIKSDTEYRVRGITFNPSSLYIDMIKDDMSIENIALNITTEAREKSWYFKKYREIKDHIVPRIVNGKAGEVLIKSGIAAVRMLDFIIVFAVKNGNDEELVTNTKLRLWGVTARQIFNDCVVTAERNDPVVLKKVQGSCFYTLTNKEQSFGASTMLYGLTLHDFAEKYGNFYIIPVSKDGVILVPEGNLILKNVDINTLIKQLKEDNRDLSMGDRLSDSLYYYDKGRYSLKIIGAKRNHYAA